jgi:hypothetical protein
LVMNFEVGDQSARFVAVALTLTGEIPNQTLRTIASPCLNTAGSFGLFLSSLA